MYAQLEQELWTVVRDVAGAYEIPTPRFHLRRAGLRRSDEAAPLRQLPGSSRSSQGVTTLFGDATPADIVVIFGNDSLDTLFVTLHEMGHAIVPPTKDALGRIRAHTVKFYSIVGELYAVYGIPLSYAVFREGGFSHKSAVRVISGRYAAYEAGA